MDSHSLVNHIVNTHSRGDLAEVGEDTTVETSEPFRSKDVSEQSQGMSLISGKRQLLPDPRLALELRSDQR